MKNLIRLVTISTVMSQRHKQTTDRQTDRRRDIQTNKQATDRQLDIHTVWVKKSPLSFSDSFPKRLGIFNQFFNLLCNPLYTRLQIFIQLFPTMTKLCHTKRATTRRIFTFHYNFNFCLFIQQMTSLVTSCRIRHVYWHYKIVSFIVTCHRQRSTKLSTT